MCEVHEDSTRKYVIIGTHCYGNDTSNSASVIEGDYGNKLVALKEAMGQPEESTSVRDIGFQLVTNCTNVSLQAQNGGSQGESAQQSAPEISKENFFKVLKSVGRVVTPIAQSALPVISPLFGPLGGPVAAIGGIALSALSKVVAQVGV